MRTSELLETQPPTQVTNQQPTRTGYGATYDVRDLAASAAAWTKSPEGQQFKRTYLIGRPGIDYDVRDLARAQKLHPEWFIVSRPGVFVNWEEPSKMGIPLAAFQAPGGYTVEKVQPTVTTQIADLFGRGSIFKSPATGEAVTEVTQTQRNITNWGRSISETWAPIPTVTKIDPTEQFLSELAFRQWWDVGYRERVQKQTKEQASWIIQHPLEYERKTAQQQEQLGVALVGLSITYPVMEWGIGKAYEKLTGIPESDWFKQSRLGVWLAKRTPQGRMEQAISWEPVEKTITTGFERAFPKDITKEITYKDYPGFEFWQTWREPIRGSGIPTFRPLSAAAQYSLKMAIENSLWGPSAILEKRDVSGMWGGPEALTGFEMWSSTAEAHPYAGYPTFYKDIVGFKLNQGPSAFDQIMKEIERGRFPRMGGMAATQIPIFGKPSIDFAFEVSRYANLLPSRRSLPMVTFAPSVSAPMKSPLSYTWKMPSFESIIGLGKPKLRTPTLIKPIDLETGWELSKQKFANITIGLRGGRTGKVWQPQVPTVDSLTKTTQRIGVPQIQPPRLKQREIITPIVIPKVIPPAPSPSPFPPIPPTPRIPPAPPSPLALIHWPGGGESSGRGGAKGLFGKWFKKRQEIKTPQQILATMFGGRKRRKHK